MVLTKKYPYHLSRDGISNTEVENEVRNTDMASSKGLEAGVVSHESMRL